MTRRTWLPALVFSLLIAQSTAPVTAQESAATLILVVESETTVGEPTFIAAYLRDPAGSPIPGEEVSFFLDVEFMNNIGRAEIGRTTTGEGGQALLPYTHKQSGARTITARFDGNDAFASTEISETLQVASGTATYTQEAPFRIPGANIVTVVVVLATTWAILLAVIGLLWLIALASSESSEPRVVQ